MEHDRRGPSGENCRVLRHIKCRALRLDMWRALRLDSKAWRFCAMCASTSGLCRVSWCIWGPENCDENPAGINETWMAIHIRQHIDKNKFANAAMCLCIYLYMYMYVYVHMYMHMYMFMCMYMHLFMYVYESVT